MLFLKESGAKISIALLEHLWDLIRQYGHAKITYVKATAMVFKP